MAIKAIQDFVQGDSFKIKIRHNPIINISGAVLQLTMSKTEESTPVLEVSYTVPNDTDAGNGIAYIEVTSEDSALVEPGKYYISIKRTLDGDVTTLVRTGLFNVGKVTCFKNLAGNS